MKKIFIAAIIVIVLAVAAFILFRGKGNELIEKIILSGIRSGEFRRCNAKEM